MKTYSDHRLALLELNRIYPRNIYIIRELVEVNAAIRAANTEEEPPYVSELYRREDWIAETN